jgi:hypothetical protein
MPLHLKLFLIGCLIGVLSQIPFCDNILRIISEFASRVFRSR